MGLSFWLGAHWFELLQSVGIVGGLALTSLALRRDTQSRRITNLLELTKQHRDIWKTLYERPEFKRVLEADMQNGVVTPEEELFVHSLVLHLNAAYHAMQDNLFVPPEGLRKDIRRFFSRPIPKRVWEHTKALHDRGFVAFVEACFEGEDALP